MRNSLHEAATSALNRQAAQVAFLGLYYLLWLALPSPRFHSTALCLVLNVYKNLNLLTKNGRRYHMMKLPSKLDTLRELAIAHHSPDK